MFSQPPTQPASIARLGFNANADFTNLAALAAIKSSGARHVRYQPAWATVESYTNPGTYSLGSKVEQALAYCGANDLEPIAVCAYGPPYQQVATLTAAAPVPAGSYAITVIEPLTIQTPLDHVMLPGNRQLSTRWGYYGGLIDSTAGQTITLAAKTAVALNAGDKVLINRLAYASPADQLITNPSVAAYFAYMQFVAGRIAANGCTGHVELWNEPPWGHDPWDARGKFYDVTPAGMNNDQRMRVFLSFLLAGRLTLPSSVRVINGASEKSGWNGLIEQFNPTPPTSSQIAASCVTLESIHPYHNLPEGQLWDRGIIRSGHETYGFELLNPTVDQSSNFMGLALAQEQVPIGLGLISTECGIAERDDTRQAIYLLRRVISSWACKMTPIVYSFGNDGSGQGYNVAAPVTFTPRLSYLALQRLTGMIAQLGPDAEAVTVTPFSLASGSWPLSVVSISGQNGVLVFIWQRSGADQTLTWDTVATPSPVDQTFHLPAGRALAGVTRLLDGSAAEATLWGSDLTVMGISEDPIVVAIR